MRDDHICFACRIPFYGILFVFISALCFACTSTPTTEEKVQSATDRYFSLEHYFAEQSRRLTQAEVMIVKTVDVNGNTETKTLKITNWESELAAFMDSDINKAAWRNSYAVDSSEHTIVYTSLEPNLRTKQIKLKRSESGEVKEIYINNEISNLLYTSQEYLRFYPDSLYEIIRDQTVRIMGKNRYQIRGQFAPTTGS